MTLLQPAPIQAQGVGELSERERAIVAAGEAILLQFRSDPSAELDPADVVRALAGTHGSYSARAALLYLIERRKVRVTKEWRVHLVI